MNKPTDSPCRDSQDTDLCVTNCSPGQGRAGQGRTGRQALEVGQHAERRAGVDAQGGGAEHGDVTRHLQQQLLGEHPPCPPRPWARQHHGHGPAGEENKGKPSAHTTALAPAVGTSYTPERELWSGCPYRWSQNAPKARDGFLAACPDLSPSLIIFQRDNGAGVPWACVQR